jgi:N-acetylglucosamine-6-phosphate deacetylase
MMVERPTPTRLAGTALLPGGRLGQAIIHVDAGRIAAAEIDPAPVVLRALRRDRAGSLVLPSHQVLAPAFIDIHCHGAGGGDVLDGPDGLERMAVTLLRHGVGAVVAAIATAPILQLMTAARMLAALRQSELPVPALGSGAQVLGLHLEGPALAPIRSDGHDAAAFAQPTDVAASLDSEPAAWQMVRVVTLAPELDGGLELVGQLAAAGVTVSIGHTNATVDVALAAYAGGARSTTHLFNGMPPLRAREPGPVGAALAAAPFVELITDGVHVDRRILTPVALAIGEERLVLVSDALPLAGSRLRRIRTPGSTARIEHGIAVHPNGTLAGSRLLLDGMVEGAVRSGIPLATALRAATENPAQLLGLTERGRLVPGAVADLVVVSRTGKLRRVFRPGTEKAEVVVSASRQWSLTGPTH